MKKNYNMLTLITTAMTVYSLSSLASAAAVAPRQCSSDDASSPCDPHTEYCNRFEGTCQPCRDLCHATGKFAECEAKCEQYLKDVIFSRPAEGPALTAKDLQTAEILLVVITVVSIATLVVMLALLVMKIKGRKRRAKEVLPMQEFRVQHPAISSPVIASSTPPVRNQVHETSNLHLPLESSVSSSTILHPNGLPNAR